MLQVEKLTKFYGKTMAIEDISFSVSKGQIVGLVGHNGCGKSTTMNIITNCLMPTSGSVSIDGISITEEPTKARSKVGYLPEIPPLYIDLSVNEQLTFACGIRNLPKSTYNDEIVRVCNALELNGVRYRRIGNLSKGYRQRVGFAQALIGTPPLLILDEPTVGLDPQQIIELRELIFSLKKEHTIILSSHILAEIAATCDKLVILSNGHLVADNTLDELKKRASNQSYYLLTADGEPEFIKNAINTLESVESCAYMVDEESDECKFYIKSINNTDVHEAVFYLLADIHCPIRKFTKIEAGIEDVFLQLTHDNRYMEHK